MLCKLLVKLDQLILLAMPSVLATDGGDGPVAKRQKISNGAGPKGSSQASRIFAPFRVGFCRSRKGPLVLTIL